MTSPKNHPNLSAQVAESVAVYVAETLKHLQGKHNQKRHSWRYGANATLGKLKRQHILSGADPIPELALAKHVQETFKGLEILDYDIPEFNPNVVY